MESNGKFSVKYIRLLKDESAILINAFIKVDIQICSISSIDVVKQ